MTLVVNQIAVYDEGMKPTTASYPMIYPLICALISAVLMLIGSFTPAAFAQDKALDALGKATTSLEAQRLEEDVWAFWLESPSAVTDVLMERALIAERRQQFDIAEALYDRIIRTNPEYAESWFRRAQLNQRAERIGEALLDFEASLQREPRHFGAWMSLGRIFLQIEAYDEAMRAFQNALAIHPYFAPAQNGLTRASKFALGVTL